ncbi:cytochrome P450 [Peristeroidobacter soli]|jgi:cytochrome P450|uniref:cytochrome P450 n=1 Tax=Peristeroidobacter soli TaxID=2497877 RepID=UPI00101C0CA3|nr:cytochrome P450 [Peristeroidobacter soli]
MSDNLASRSGPIVNYTLDVFPEPPPTLEAARAHAYSQPLAEIDVANPKLFHADLVGPYFERLRREDPVHYVESPTFGGYWSITRYHDIMAVDMNHQQFSSDAAQGGITINTTTNALPMFIAMDPPRHDVQRNAVQPIVAPDNLRNLEPLIRSRAAAILDELPIGVEFDWADKVSMELTAMTLATLMDFPQPERRRLTRWSDVATAVPGGGVIDTPDQWVKEMGECFETFQKLWHERAASPAGKDLISMLAHGEGTRNMSPYEYQGNIVLLIVGGNDTTRNSITGSVLALNQNPDQYQKLREHPELVPAMVSETIRWQTPLAHMRRTAVQDVQLNGKRIRTGDKVVMWYLSGNRDESIIERPDDYIIGRPKARQHLSFGSGIHRCVGSRLAEMQLRVIWEEILKRFPLIEVVGAPERVYSTFVRGYRSLPVRIPRRH